MTGRAILRQSKDIEQICFFEVGRTLHPAAQRVPVYLLQSLPVIVKSWVRAVVDV